jgi:Flp pilus assembly protein TadD
MDAPTTEFYRLSDVAGELARKRQYDAAAVEWKKAVDLEPDDGKAHDHLAFALDKRGQLADAHRPLPEIRGIGSRERRGVLQLGRRPHPRW